MKAADQEVERLWRRVGACILHVNQALRHVDLIVRQELDVFIGLSFFDYAFAIHRKFLAILARQFHLSFVCKITEAARLTDRLTHAVTFVRGNFLWSLTFDRAINIYSLARFLADS